MFMSINHFYVSDRVFMSFHFQKRAELSRYSQTFLSNNIMESLGQSFNLSATPAQAQGLETAVKGTGDLLSKL